MVRESRSQHGPTIRCRVPAPRAPPRETRSTVPGRAHAAILLPPPGFGASHSGHLARSAALLLLSACSTIRASSRLEQRSHSWCRHCGSMTAALRSARREFFTEILYNNIAIIAIQHSKINFVDTFGNFSHTLEWNSVKSVWQISLYTYYYPPRVEGSNYHTLW